MPCSLCTSPAAIAMAKACARACSSASVGAGASSSSVFSCGRNHACFLGSGLCQHEHTQELTYKTSIDLASTSKMWRALGGQLGEVSVLILWTFACADGRL